MGYGKPAYCWIANKYVLGGLCLLFFLLFSGFQSIADTPVYSYVLPTDKLKRVLILNSYHQSYIWTDQITQAIIKQISPQFSDAEFYVEYLDAKRMCNEELTQNIYRTIKQKYRQIKLDAIVVSDDDALLFMLRFHDELFPGVPVVFCGINDENIIYKLPRRYYTGLLEVLDIKPNLELIQKLQPQAKKLYIICDASTTGLALRRTMQEIAPQFPDLKFIYLKGEELSTGELLEKLRQLDQKSVVYINVWSRDKNNQFIAWKDIVPLITSNSPVPVFGMIDLLLDFGIVGGKMNGGDIQGRIAGGMALSILRGASPADLPIEVKSRNEYHFNYPQLQRFGIDENLLPQGSIIHNRPFSFYQTYKPLVWSVLIILLTFMGLTIALAINTQRLRAAQRELIRNKKDLDIILDSLGEGVIATDLSGEIIRMNPVSERMTGWSEKEAIGLPFNKVFCAISAEKENNIESPVESVVSSGFQVTLEKNALLISRDKNEYQIAGNCSPLRDENNQIIGTVAIFHDTTEEFALQEKLRQAEKLRSVGQLAGGIAHDFNNMLAGIVGAAELLTLRVAEKEKMYVNIIKDAARRASSLTGQLLVFSHKKQFILAPLNVHKTLNDAVELLTHSIDKRIIIQQEMLAKKSIISGDDDQLQNAFLNLGINAGQAMPDGGTLTFSTRNLILDKIYCDTSPFELHPGEYIEIEVRDTGCGIPLENIARIFEPFFTTKEQGKGTGLGLSAVYGTVQSHHGAINVYSEINSGTVFHIYLPVSDSRLPEQQSDAEPPTHGGTILIVDDEDLVRTTASYLLEDHGYKTLTAMDGLEAIELYRKYSREIDLIVLDIIMPRMNGREAFAHLLEINPKVRILISSGFAKDADIEAFKTMATCDFIRKPYARQEFLHAIAELLKRPQKDT